MKILKKAFTDDIKRYPAKSKTSHKSEIALFDLIIEHPDYIEGVVELRKNAGLPIEGILDQSEANLWEQENKNARDRLRKDVELLVFQFTYPRVFQERLLGFTYDGIVCPSRVQEHFEHPQINTAIIRTTEIRELNKWLISPSSLYIQITQTTTLRDLEKAYADLKDWKSSLPFNVYKPEQVITLVWQLSRPGTLRDKEIAKLVKEKFNSKSFTYSKVLQYRKRFKDGLSRLKPLGKDYRNRLRTLPTIF